MHAIVAQPTSLAFAWVFMATHIVNSIRACPLRLEKEDTHYAWMDGYRLQLAHFIIHLKISVQFQGYVWNLSPCARSQSRSKGEITEESASVWATPTFHMSPPARA